MNIEHFIGLERAQNGYIMCYSITANLKIEMSSIVPVRKSLHCSITPSNMKFRLA